MTVIIPTVGRVVHFHPGPHDKVRFAHIANPHEPDQIQPFAAIVAYVWGDDRVNLTVSDHAGNTHPMQSVKLIQEGEEAPEDLCYCEWMKYQKQVAAGEIAPVLHAQAPSVGSGG